jgi:hypothetical protein
MTILEVIEYKEERIALVTDDHGKFVYSDKNPNPVSLYEESVYVHSQDRERMLL